MKSGFLKVPDMDSLENYILIVDDSEDDIDLTCNALRRGKLTNELVIARDGREALDFLFNNTLYEGKQLGLPCVVLLDLNMPRIGGLEVIQQLRNNPSTKYLPVVIFTTSDEDRDIIDSYRFGANSYVKKPVNTEEFFRAVQELQIYWTLRNSTPPMHEK